MKKSEALNILGLSDGATDDAVKQAHRKLVIEHHPDKFALGSKEREEAEEFTKRINEARDVLLNRSWTPEFDPRRDPRPYANNPYAHPTQNPYGGAGQGGDPFAGWPFGQAPGQGQGQSTCVWTAWDAPRSGGTRVGLVIAGKVALLAVAALAGTAATGLFLYVMISIVYGLWKRFGSCLIGLIVPLMLLGAPFVFIIAPRQGAVTAGLAVAFLFAVLFDVVNVRNLLRALRVARRATS